MTITIMILAIDVAKHEVNKKWKENVSEKDT